MWVSGNTPQWIWIEMQQYLEWNTTIVTQENEFEIVLCKMLIILSQPQHIKYR